MDIDLYNDEEIIFKGKANVEKVDKKIKEYFIFLVVLITSLVAMFYIFVHNKNFNVILITNILIGMLVVIIWSIFHNYSLMKKNKGAQYLITDRRIIVKYMNCDAIEKNIADISYVGVSREKNNFGNMMFTFKEDNISESIKGSIEFWGIESPRAIVKEILKIVPSITTYDEKSMNI